MFVSALLDIHPGQKGVTTLKRASYFSVRSGDGLLYPKGSNAGRLIKSALSGAMAGNAMDSILELAK